MLNVKHFKVSASIGRVEWGTAAGQSDEEAEAAANTVAEGRVGKPENLLQAIWPVLIRKLISC